MTGNGGDRRPSPEAMLKIAQADEESVQRGKLKIFLGYAAGVGKTYSMLETARRNTHEGCDIVVGYVESHGRTETDALLEGLEVMPRRAIAYQGVVLQEMDIDSLLARKPCTTLVDELAHTNAPGSRHEKRWQDVEELLAAGINVYTTVNIQHIESLNDVVAQITGIIVRETVPDRLLETADEIRLVDIPPADLLQRLHEGKVYVQEQAAWAVEKFFKPGNLMALRELSLRRTAARVDEQMRAYMERRSIAGPWPVTERLLVCVSGSPYSERLIRATARLAEELKADWFTAYIETPETGRHARENRERVWQNLRLAESIGAQVTTITAAAVPEAVMDFAIRHNVTKIVVGKPIKKRWRELIHPPIVDQIIRGSGTIDVVVVSFDPGARTPAPRAPHQKPRASDMRGYLSSVTLVIGASMLCQLVSPIFTPTNMVMIYLLAVVLAAVRLGQRPAIATAFLGVLAFDFFFVPPRFSFTVSDTQYLMTFISLFVVGIVISSLVTRARERAEVMRSREIQTASLYYLSRDLAAAADMASVTKAIMRNTEEALRARAVLLLSGDSRLDMVSSNAALDLHDKELAVADWAFRNRKPAGRGTDTLVSSGLLYLPLQTQSSVLGVLGVSLENEGDYHSEDIRRLLDAFVTQAAMAIERIRFSHQAEQTQILQARETLERALLNSISHDLRTPLVTVTGVLTSLRDESAHLSEKARRDLLETACDEAARLNRFVGNLLDMTRIEAGVVHLHVEPVDVQDLAGCALAAIEQRSGDRHIDVHIPDSLPPAEIDLVLMTQVMVNVLDNALKYAPAGGTIELEAHADDSWIVVDVADRGPGVPEPELERIFDKFYRIPIPEGSGSTGLGLSICKGIVEAHGGSITAHNRAGGGLTVSIRMKAAEERAADDR